MTPLSVVIPIGPEPHQRAHVHECVNSVLEQTQAPDEILLLDSLPDTTEYPSSRIRYWYAPWADSIANKFNLGVSMARNHLVLMLGSDDKLYPRCVEVCGEAWNRHGRIELGWYFLGVRYSNGYEQNTPCLAAMVTKTLWNKSGGLKADYRPYPATEIEFISRMLVAKGELGATYRVSDEVLYWHRIHSPGTVGIAL